MKVPDGLLFFEYILLLLGVVLFFTLLVILIIYVARKQAIKGLLPFFAIPIIMIGYPSIQKISFNKDGVDITKLSKELEANPDDENVRAELVKELDKINDKRVNTNDFKIELAKSSALIEDRTRANKYLRSIDIKNPEEERQVEGVRSLMERK